jgi:hypothetical protein
MAEQADRKDTMTTSLVPQTPVEIKDTDSLAEILRKATEAAHKPNAKALQKPSDATAPVGVSEGTRKALTSLYDLLGAVQLPSERRALTPAEQENAARLHSSAKQAETAVKEAIEAVRTAIFNHLDFELEKAGTAGGVAKDKKGFYLVAGEVPIPAQRVRMTRELRERSPEVTPDHLRSLLRRGKISHAEYKKITKTEVTVDDAGLTSLLKAKPNVLLDLADEIGPGTVWSALYTKPMEEDDEKE